MLWLLVDLAIAFLAVLGLVLAALAVWRRTKALGRTLSDAGTRVGRAAEQIPPLERGADDT